MEKQLCACMCLLAGDPTREILTHQSHASTMRCSAFSFPIGLCHRLLIYGDHQDMHNGIFWGQYLEVCYPTIPRCTNAFGGERLEGYGAIPYHYGGAAAPHFGLFAAIKDLSGRHSRTVHSSIQCEVLGCFDPEHSKIRLLPKSRAECPRLPKQRKSW